MSFELKGIGLTKLHIDFAPAKDASRPRGELISMNFEVELQKSTTIERQFRVLLNAKFSEHTKEKVLAGFQVEAGTSCVVLVGDEVEAEKVQISAEMNAVGMMFGTLRGVLLSATGAFPNGPLTLRSVMPGKILGIAQRSKRTDSSAETPSGKIEPTQPALPERGKSPAKRPIRTRK